jgi:DNA invertase Pin-like site-specific DNA recombinase
MKRRPGSDRVGLVHALLYTRVSGAEHQKEGLSLEAQTQTTRTYAASKQGWVIAGEYQDVMSGKRADRPQYQAMLEHARRLDRGHERTAIVVIRLSRLGRNKAEYFRTAEELAKQGAEVHSIKDGGVLDETHASILAVFAAKEAQQIGEWVGETRSHLVMNGWHYGRTPFGYRKRPASSEERAAGSPHSVLEIDPAARGVALEAFERVVAGESVRSVALWLAALPERLRGGRAWPANSVSVILRSPTYVARPTEGVDDVLARPVARWEPLVSDELWQTVQEHLADHVLRPHQSSGQYLLTGFLRCDLCGHRMVGTTRRRNDRGGERRYDYRCTGWQRGANAPSMDCRRSTPLGPADRAVLDQVADMLGVLADPERWPALTRAWEARNAPTTDSTRQIAELEREIQTAQHRLADAAGLLVDGTLDRLGYEVLRDRDTKRITAAKDERDRLQANGQWPSARRLPSAAQVFELVGGWANALHTAAVPQQRDLLDKLIDHVVVTRSAHRRYDATITWTPLGQMLSVKNLSGE